MGRQQSLVKFKDNNTLIKEMKKYDHRDTTNDQAYVICINEVIKEIEPFNKGELVAVTSGERYEQRSPMNLRKGLGLGSVKYVEAIDSSRFVTASMIRNVNLGELLDSHFRTLSEDEHKELINERGGVK